VIDLVFSKVSTKQSTKFVASNHEPEGEDPFFMRGTYDLKGLAVAVCRLERVAPAYAAGFQTDTLLASFSLLRPLVQRIFNLPAVGCFTFRAFVFSRLRGWFSVFSTLDTLAEGPEPVEGLTLDTLDTS
jgi:hypothetical protein